MTFDAIGIAGTGLTVHRKWLDAVSDNLANINTVTTTDGNAFQARYVVAQEGARATGVYVAGTALGDAEGRLVYEPDHPLADAKGNVRYPDIDMASADGAADHGPTRLPGQRRRRGPRQGNLPGRPPDRTMVMR